MAEVFRTHDLSELLFTRGVAPEGTVRQRATHAETTPSRSPGTGLVGRMRENADLALIRPVEASALVGEASGVGL